MAPKLRPSSSNKSGTSFGKLLPGLAAGHEVIAVELQARGRTADDEWPLPQTDGGVGRDVSGLPASRLAILPGTTHVTLVQRADLLLSMIVPFLDAPMPDV